MASAPGPALDTLPKTAATWSVAAEGNDRLNYGQIHELIHRDVSVGNDYRKERIKLLITLATGVFALTVTFHKDLFGETLTSTGLSLLLVGWLALLISLLSGIYHFRYWEDFYLEHRALGNAIWASRVALQEPKDPRAQADAASKFLNAGRKIRKLQKAYATANWIQTTTLVGGLAFIMAYVVYAGSLVINVDHKPMVDQPKHVTSAK